MRSHFSFYINDYIIYVVLRREIDEEFVSVYPIPGIFACYICIIAFHKTYHVYVFCMCTDERLHDDDTCGEGWHQLKSIITTSLWLNEMLQLRSVHIAPHVIINYN